MVIATIPKYKSATSVALASTNRKPITISETNNTPSEKTEFTPFSRELKALEVPCVAAYIISSKEYFLASARLPLNLISDIRFAAFDSIFAMKKTAQPVRTMFSNDLETNKPIIIAAKIGTVWFVTLGSAMPANSIFGPTSPDAIAPKDVAKYPMAAIATMSRNASVDLTTTSANQISFSIPVKKERLNFIDLSIIKV
jgi:hypothetical protein